jgi:hypothetical protein
MISLHGRVKCGDNFGRVLEGPVNREGIRACRVKWENANPTWQSWEPVERLESAKWAEIPKGTRVSIPKGTRYHSTKDGMYHYTKKPYTVTVQVRSGDYTPDVTWAGVGGYWKRASKCDVVILED